MKLRAVLLLLLTGLAVWSCKPLDERADPNPSLALRFDTDTVMFDTVFTERKTITQRLLVHNDNSGAITLESVTLSNGTGAFSFYINGRPGPDVKNLEILGKDSAYVLISGKLPASGQNTPLVFEDSLLFQVKGRSERQQVVVVAKGQDARYVDSLYIGSDTTFTAEKPIVVFGYVFVDSTATLTIQPGARIHLYKNSYFIVKGQLKAVGTPEQPIRFTGTRLESYYSLVPSQWGYIGFIPPSAENEMRYCIVENGMRGVQVGIPNQPQPRVDLEISNTLIRNVGDAGLWGFNAKIAGYNLVISDCGASYILGQIGGEYAFAHTTLATSGNTPFNRKAPMVYFSNFYQESEGSPVIQNTPPKLTLYNNLIYGSLQDEFILKNFPTTTTTDLTDVQNNGIYGRRNTNFATTNRFFLNTFSASDLPTFSKGMNYDFQPDSAEVDFTRTVSTPVSSFAFKFPRSGRLYSDYLNRERDANQPTIGAVEKKHP